MTNQNELILAKTKLKPMLGLSFDTKSNVSVFAMYLNATIVFSVYVGLLHSRNNIHIKQNVSHNFTHA